MSWAASRPRVGRAAARRAAGDPAVAVDNTLGATAVATYVLLWLLEGAIRKWVPGASTVMYVARDAVLIAFAIAQYATAPRRRGAVVSFVFWTLVTLLLVLGALQVAVLGEPVSIAILGLRNYLAPITFAYLFWRFWRPQGALLLRLLLAALPIEVVLTALQVVSPASSFVNLSVNGEATSLATADGVVRGSGTFSDAGTLASYYTIILAVCLGLLAEQVAVVRHRWLYAALAGDLLAMAIAGERTAIFWSAAVLVVWLVRAVLRAELRSLGAAAAVIVLGLAIFGVAASFYGSVLNAFGQRFVQANQQENSAGRVIGSATDFLSSPLDVLGTGAGSRSNAALALGGGQFWIESELSRWVVELGVLGFVLVIARVAIGVVLGIRVVFGLTSLPALTVTISCVLAPQLVAGSVAVNPAVEGAAAVTAAIYAWSTWAPRLRPARAEVRS